MGLDFDLDDVMLGPMFLVPMVSVRRSSAKAILRQVVLSVLVVAALGFGGFCRIERAHAQVGFDAQRFTPALDDYGFLTLQGTRTPGSWRWNVGLVSNFSHSLLNVPRTAQGELGVIQNRLNETLGFQLGLWGRGAVGLQLPFVMQSGFANAGTATSTGGVRDVSIQSVDPSGVALADPRLSLRYRVLGRNADELKDSNDGFGLALQSRVYLPLGNDSAFAGERRARIDGSLLVDFRLFGAGVGFEAGYRHRFEAMAWNGLPIRDELQSKVGVEVPILAEIDLSGLTELRFATDAKKPFTGNMLNVLEADVGGRISFRDFSITFAGGSRLLTEVASPAWQATLSVTYLQLVHDSDNDGVPDDRDECRELPEDRDGFQDKDGCLDPDNDNDLIPDEDDRCANEAVDEDNDRNADGCPDE